MKAWRKASFTVEAAFIIPFSLLIILILIGFCYYEHQINWCKGAAYEAVLYGIYEGGSDGGAAQAAAERLRERADEAPLNVGEITTSSSHFIGIKAAYETSVLPGTFGDTYKITGEVSLIRFEPSRKKLLEFILNNLKV
ncbi:MAG: pilus assembly protein [Lachnospiraceae bacterium]|nr:pilus assembly protein [Lachnospiraceae bacterium]